MGSCHLSSGEQPIGVCVLRTFVYEFWLFGLKQARACVFGGFLLSAMLLTKLWYPLEPFHRCDFLLLAAVAFQVLVLICRPRPSGEVSVVIIFCVLAMGMEVFKTSAPVYSWHYPEEYTVGIGKVPLVVGFMYGAVGSYIARSWRILDLRFSTYPSMRASIVLVSFIYLNFFTHHYIYDFRWILLAVAVLLFGRCAVYFRVDTKHRRVPLMLGWLLIASFIWIAENIGTYSGIWLYPFQVDGWRLVPLSKLTSWFLLMIVSFVLVSLVHKPKLVGRETPGRHRAAEEEEKKELNRGLR